MPDEVPPRGVARHKRRIILGLVMTALTSGASALTDRLVNRAWEAERVYWERYVEGTVWKCPGAKHLLETLPAPPAAPK